MIKNYLEQMLLNIADELNVKEVILEKDNVYATYLYDTISGESIGFKSGEEIMASLLFSGDVLSDMEIVRDIVSNGLNLRAQTKVKVRQPLRSITIKLPYQVAN